MLDLTRKNKPFESIKRASVPCRLCFPMRYSAFQVLMSIARHGIPSSAYPSHGVFCMHHVGHGSHGCDRDHPRSDQSKPPERGSDIWVPGGDWWPWAEGSAYQKRTTPNAAYAPVITEIAHAPLSILSLIQRLQRRYPITAATVGVSKCTGILVLVPSGRSLA